MDLAEADEGVAVALNVDTRTGIAKNIAPFYHARALIGDVNAIAFAVVYLALADDGVADLAYHNAWPAIAKDIAVFYDSLCVVGNDYPFALAAVDAAIPYDGACLRTVDMHTCQRI
jgi:hypothetical protein